MKQTKITHLTSAHPRYDTRIFLKECSSLAKIQNYEVSLIVADGLGFENKSSVNIIDVGAKEGGRLSRMTKTVKRVYQKAKELDSDIYHLHDPELIPIGLKLKKKGKKVIFDAHEDLPKQILDKEYLNIFFKVIFSKAFTYFEKWTCNTFDYIITATPYIKNKFEKINFNTIDINNFPILGELSNETKWDEKSNEICYVGYITKVRGVKELVEAITYLDDIKLNLVGEFSEKNLEDEIKKLDGWKSTNFLGFLDRKNVAKIMSKSKVGIVTFYPLPNHIDAQPNKMFEYMSAGLPLITSNFPFWREIVEGNKCGICINPLEPKEIADAIKYIITHQEEAKQMGQNGKKAVLEKYNWRIEEKKLYNIYEELSKR